MNSTMDCENFVCVDDHVLRVYITWGGILLIKVLLMSILTAVHRTRKGAFENNEDTAMAKANAEIKKDEDVERVRRAHLNDLENCVPFLIACGFYIIANPNSTVASWLIRIGVLARIFHTIVYALYPIRQPARTICFFITLLITFFMLFYSIVKLFRF